MPTTDRGERVDGGRRLRTLLLVLAVSLGTGFAGFGSADAGRQATRCAPEAADGSPVATAAGAELAWVELPGMPRPRSELGAAALDGVIYVVGGFGGSPFDPVVGGAGVDCFDARTGTWAIAADLPVGVHHPGVAALDGRIYVAGGYTDAGAATAALWAYDPAADAWEARAEMPTARGALGLAALDGRLYAVGGALERLGGPVTGAVEA